MNYGEAKKVLAANGQDHILRFWSGLGTAARKALLAQIATIDFKELARCRAMLPGAGAVAADAKGGVSPTAPKVAELKGKAQAAAFAAGAKELAAGRVAVRAADAGSCGLRARDRAGVRAAGKGAWPCGQIDSARPVG